MSKATMRDRVVVTEGILHRQIEDETVLVNLDSGIYFGLDAVGASIWSRLLEDGRIQSAYEALLREYDVAPERLAEDLLELIDELSEQGLLRVVTATDADPS